MYILTRITKVEKTLRIRTKKKKIVAIITTAENEYLLYIVHSQYISILITIRMIEFKIEDIMIADEKEFEIFTNIEKRVLGVISEKLDT